MGTKGLNLFFLIYRCRRTQGKKKNTNEKVKEQPKEIVDRGCLMSSVMERYIAPFFHT